MKIPKKEEFYIEGKLIFSIYPEGLMKAFIMSVKCLFPAINYRQQSFGLLTLTCGLPMFIDECRLATGDLRLRTYDLRLTTED